MPFTAAIVDDGDDAREVLFVHKRKDLIALLAMQDEPRVVQIRELRTTLRAFAVSNGCVHYEFSQMETHKVQDGFETYYETDANGNRVQKQRPRMINVQVEMFYHYGTMGIGSRVSSDTFSNGFDPSLSFHDGHGEVLLPNTREMHYFTNMSTTFGAGRLGYDHGPLRVAPSSRRSSTAPCREPPAARQGVRTWLKMVAEQRHKWWAKRRADEDTLDSAFWLYVYENHFDLDRAGIERSSTNTSAARCASCRATPRSSPVSTCSSGTWRTSTPGPSPSSGTSSGTACGRTTPTSPSSRNPPTCSTRSAPTRGPSRPPRLTQENARRAQARQVVRRQGRLAVRGHRQLFGWNKSGNPCARRRGDRRPERGGLMDHGGAAWQLQPPPSLFNSPRPPLRMRRSRAAERTSDDRWCKIAPQIPLK